MKTLFPVAALLAVVAMVRADDPLPGSETRYTSLGEQVTEERLAETLSSEFADSTQTIAGWVEQVNSARTRSYRQAAANALWQIAENYGRDYIALSDDEIQTIENGLANGIKNKDPVIRNNCLQAIKYFSGETTNKALKESFAKERIPDNRVLAIKAVGYLKEASLIPQLKSILTFNKGTSEQRFAAIAALEEIGGDEIVSIFESTLKSTRHPELKAAVTQALDRLEGRRQ